MRFLLKLATLCFLGLLILPSIYPDAEADDESGVGERVTAMQLAVSTATFAASVAADMKQLCERDEYACAHGNLVFSMAMERARRGANIVMSMIGSSAPTPSIDRETATGSVKAE
ncbi:MAG: DUF5330 domain-containing protein [Pseudomonadota bacterium]